MFNDLMKIYIKMDFFRQLVNIGLLDSTCNAILKMYNICIDFERLLDSKDFKNNEIQRLLDLDVEFECLKFYLYLELKKKER